MQQSSAISNYRPDAGLQGESGRVIIPQKAPVGMRLAGIHSRSFIYHFKNGKINTFREAGGIQDVFNYLQ